MIPQTEVIVLISKPPSNIIAERIVEAVKDSPKPVVINFVGGGDRTIIENMA